jgi:hypothetical protein
MLTARENFLELLGGGTPERLVNQYEPFEFILVEPLLAQSINRKEGEDIPDAWGTVIRWKKGEHAGMPYITEDNKVCPDVTQWRKYVKAPNITNPAFDWSAATDLIRKTNRREKLVTLFMPTGLFEQCHFLMGFEDTLMNLLIEPKAMHELLDYILNWKMLYAKELIDHLGPDAILLHDDWGAKTRLFMSPEIWREFFKPRFEKLHKYIKNRGVLVIHHADSYCSEILEDMEEIHIDVWQGVLPQNNIPALQERLDAIDARMLLMGGIDAGVIDFPDWTEEAVRAETRRACDEYVPGGRFIPCITYGLPESIYPGVFECISDEIDKYGPEFYRYFLLL